MTDLNLAGAGDNWMDDYAPHRLLRVTSKLNSGLAGKLRGLGLNLSQWRVLSVLKAYGPSNMGAIVQLTAMEQPTVSRVVSQLDEMTMIERRTVPSDARVTEVALTAKGEAAAAQLVSAALRLQARAFDGIPTKDLAALMQTLSRIEHNVEAS